MLGLLQPSSPEPGRARLIELGREDASWPQAPGPGASSPSVAQDRPGEFHSVSSHHLRPRRGTAKPTPDASRGEATIPDHARLAGFAPCPPRRKSLDRPDTGVKSRWQLSTGDVVFRAHPPQKLDAPPPISGDPRDGLLSWSPQMCQRRPMTPVLNHRTICVDPMSRPGCLYA